MLPGLVGFDDQLTFVPIAYSLERRDYAGTPFSTGRPGDDCCPMISGGKNSVCDGNAYDHHAALCYCN